MEENFWIKLLIHWALMFVLALHITGCVAFGSLDRELVEFDGMQVDPAVVSHLREFKRYYHCPFVHTRRIVFAKIATLNPYGQTIGYCNIFTKTIVLDYEYWMYASYNAKESLVFHELGHCELGILMHRDSDSYSNPRSIMNSNNIGSLSAYYYNRDKYVWELFAGIQCPQPISIMEDFDAKY